MSLAAIINAVFAAGVTVMVTAPLLWAIVTQHRDDPDSATPGAVTAGHPQAPGQQRVQQPAQQRPQQPRYQPVIGRA